jgi:hypothetical protein
MQKAIQLLAAVLLAGFVSVASAQLRPYQDYTISDAVSTVTTVRVHANMQDKYLEGLRDTWVASNEVAKRLGYIKDYAIYASDLPASGDFNLLLVVRYRNTADLAPSRERYEAFMREWGEANEEKNKKFSSTVYPNIRDITGDYLMREITVKPR